MPNSIAHAEAAGINLNLNEQNRLKDLIVKSAVNGEKERSFEGYMINQLAKRFERLNVINEKDCIRIKPKCWIEDKSSNGERLTTFSESMALHGSLVAKIAAG